MDPVNRASSTRDGKVFRLRFEAGEALIYDQLMRKIAEFDRDIVGVQPNEVRRPDRVDRERSASEVATFSLLFGRKKHTKV